MDAYEVKQYLSQCWKIRCEISAKHEALYNLRSLAEKTTSSFSLAPSGSGEGSKVEHYAIQIVTMQQDMEGCIQDLIKVQREAEAMIEIASDPLARAMLTEYHMNGKTAEDTAFAFGYSVRHMFRILNKAYEEIADKLSLNVTDTL